MKKPAAPARPKLATLQPRVGIADLSIATPLKPQTNAARLRGRRAQERRKRWFALHPLCVHCEQRGRTTIATQLDHVVPLFRGGVDDDSNFQSLCLACHQAKTADELRGGGL